MRINHTVHGDGVAITAELPTEAVTAIGDECIEITLGEVEWFEVAQRVMHERDRAAPGRDTGVLALRFETELGDVASRLLAAGPTPETGQRHAVASVLRRLADMVVGGSLRGVNVEWSAGAPGDRPCLDVWYRTSRRSGEVRIPLSRPAQVAP